MQRIYLDYNANAPLQVPVVKRIGEILALGPMNPGSIHWHGQRARAELEAARRTLLRAIAGHSGTLTFTSGATEANNMVLAGVPKGATILLSRLEHPSVSQLGEDLAHRGRVIRWMPHDSCGRINTLDVEQMIDDEVALISLMAANNETGNLNPIGELAERAARRGVPFHVDASQLVGRLPLSVPSGVSALTLSAHKAGGPVGVGGLWLRKGFDVEPLLGGGHQERGRRAGTENVALAAGFATMLENADFDAWRRLAEIRDSFEDLMSARFDLTINGDVDCRLPNTSNLSLLGYTSEEVVMALDLAGISVSAGSACTAGALDDSPVLVALGIGPARVKSAIRFSFGPEHLGIDVSGLVDRIAAALGR